MSTWAILQQHYGYKMKITRMNRDGKMKALIIKAGVPVARIDEYSTGDELSRAAREWSVNQFAEEIKQHG